MGGKITESICEFANNKDNIETIKNLSKLLNIKPHQEIIKVESLISGKNILFTGTMEKMTRKEAKEIAEKLGAKICSAISKNVDLLVAGESTGSKLKDAKTLGVKVINENEWLKIINL